MFSDAPVYDKGLMTYAWKLRLFQETLKISPVGGFLLSVECVFP